MLKASRQLRKISERVPENGKDILSKTRLPHLKSGVHQRYAAHASEPKEG
jgi:hypothetical protein